MAVRESGVCQRVGAGGGAGQRADFHRCSLFCEAKLNPNQTQIDAKTGKRRSSTFSSLLGSDGAAPVFLFNLLSVLVVLASISTTYLQLLIIRSSITNLAPPPAEH